MKKIEIKDISVKYSKWLWIVPSAYVAYIGIDFFTHNSVSYGSLINAILISAFIFYTKNRDICCCNLEFGSADLVCKIKDTIYWHIPYKCISHFSVETTNTYLFGVYKSSTSLIHTKDGDSYSIPGKISTTQNEEIRRALESVIS